MALCYVYLACVSCGEVNLDLTCEPNRFRVLHKNSYIDRESPSPHLDIHGTRIKGNVRSAQRTRGLRRRPELAKL